MSQTKTQNLRRAWTDYRQAKQTLISALVDVMPDDVLEQQVEMTLAEDKPEPARSVESKPKSAKSKPKSVEPKPKSVEPKPKTWSTVTEESKKNASEGRGAVARGDRPPLKTAMVKVMGTKVMNAAGVVEALEAKGWLPSSSDPHQYVSYMLSSNQPQVFERTERRGHYRVRPGYLKVASKPKAATPKTPAKEAPKTPTKEAPKKGPKWKDDIMKVFAEHEWEAASAQHLSTYLAVPGGSLSSSLNILVREGKLKREVTGNAVIYHRVVQ